MDLIPAQGVPNSSQAKAGQEIVFNQLFIAYLYCNIKSNIYVCVINKKEITGIGFAGI